MRDGVFGGLRFSDHGLAMRVETLAGIGDGEAACRALDQANAEPFFQLRDAPGQSRFGDIERAPRRSEAAFFDDDREVVQIVEVLHRSPHRSIPKPVYQF